LPLRIRCSRTTQYAALRVLAAPGIRPAAAQADGVGNRHTVMTIPPLKKGGTGGFALRVTMFTFHRLRRRMPR